MNLPFIANKLAGIFHFTHNNIEYLSHTLWTWNGGRRRATVSSRVFTVQYNGHMASANLLWVNNAIPTTRTVQMFFQVWRSAQPWAILIVRTQLLHWRIATSGSRWNPSMCTCIYDDVLACHEILCLKVWSFVSYTTMSMKRYVWPVACCSVATWPNKGPRNACFSLRSRIYPRLEFRVVNWRWYANCVWNMGVPLKPQFVRFVAHIAICFATLVYSVPLASSHSKSVQAYRVRGPICSFLRTFQRLAEISRVEMELGKWLNSELMRDLRG